MVCEREFLGHGRRVGTGPADEHRHLHHHSGTDPDDHTAAHHHGDHDAAELGHDIAATEGLHLPRGPVDHIDTLHDHGGADVSSADPDQVRAADSVDPALADDLTTGDDGPLSRATPADR
ncbi:hypothetical protein [Nocardia neocaledoniensis]|uniref:hypothetical protein n=1 Tax=Nocardia neocaledoniensis TaxID=236511 RepID=UPI002454A79D|nr:hypothetical protein [Nocardia neocaledoniensis]